MEDIQNLFKETIAEFMENGLEADLMTIEGFDRQLRKVTKAKSVVPTDDKPVENTLPCHDEHNEEMDRPPGLEGLSSKVCKLI